MFKLVQNEIADFDEKIYMVEEEQFEIVHSISESIFEELISELVFEFTIKWNCSS